MSCHVCASNHNFQFQSIWAILLLLEKYFQFFLYHYIETILIAVVLVVNHVSQIFFLSNQILKSFKQARNARGSYCLFCTLQEWWICCIGARDCALQSNVQQYLVWTFQTNHSITLLLPYGTVCLLTYIMLLITPLLLHLFQTLAFLISPLLFF